MDWEASLFNRTGVPPDFLQALRIPIETYKIRDPIASLRLHKNVPKKTVGCVEPAKNKIDDYSSGRFVAKPLHLPARSCFGEGRAVPLTYCCSLSKSIAKVTRDDVTCCP